MARDNTGPDVPRGEAGRWLPGTSPNPGGRPKKLREIEEMLDAEHRTPENMRVVFARLKALALGEIIHEVDKDGEVTIGLSADPAFMKLYLDRTLGPVKEVVSDDDLRDAPDAVLEWIASRN